jgi:tetratricopeptide (TPR) repeat protein
MRAVAARRPEVLFLAALLALAVVATWRMAEQPSGPVGVDISMPAVAGPGDPRSIARLQERLRRNPNDVDAAASLGLALLQRARETGDPGLYAQAEQALQLALAREPDHVEALVGQGALALARHHFAEALEWGERASAAAPQLAAVYGVLADAYVELGRYDEAVAAAQRMVDIRPGIDSYSRVAYLRELHGDLPGAAAAMAMAVEAGTPGAENAAWASVQLGNLRLAQGDVAGAKEVFAGALAQRPGYPHAEAGLARVAAARGELAAAARGYEAALARLPLPEFAIALGDIYEAQGLADEAMQQRGLVRAMQQLNAGAGVDVDMELALFDADHGPDPQATVAKARAAYDRRPSIYAADALAWALHRAGRDDEAAQYSVQALRLGTRDPALRLRAGLIAAARGDTAAAREHLLIAHAGAATLTPTQVREATQALAALQP